MVCEYLWCVKLLDSPVSDLVTGIRVDWLLSKGEDEREPSASDLFTF